MVIFYSYVSLPEGIQGDALPLTIWFFNMAMERSTILKRCLPSISMGHGFHGYVK